MDEKQQIEDMAILIRTGIAHNCSCETIANVMYDTGYRKQSDGGFTLFKPRRENRNATYKCSVCGKACSSYYNDVGQWKYCPHCGTKMKGGEGDGV